MLIGRGMDRRVRSSALENEFNRLSDVSQLNALVEPPLITSTATAVAATEIATRRRMGTPSCNHMDARTSPSAINVRAAITASSLINPCWKSDTIVVGV